MTKINRMVIDTNVFIDALFGEETSDSANLLASLDEIGFRLVFSQELIGEMMYIMKRQSNKLGFDYESTKENLMFVVDFFLLGKSINTRHIDKEALPIINNPDDQMLVEAAYAADAEYLITLDKRSGILELEDTPLFLLYAK